MDSRPSSPPTCCSSKAQAWAATHSSTFSRLQSESAILCNLPRASGNVKWEMTTEENGSCAACKTKLSKVDIEDGYFDTLRDAFFKFFWSNVEKSAMGLKKEANGMLKVVEDVKRANPTKK